MEEDEYKSTYHEINHQRCVFEKSVNSRRVNCEKSQRFFLADREGIACNSASAQARCRILLDKLRSNARFSLHLTIADSPLPHSKEIKVQAGGLLGLQSAVYPELAREQAVHDVNALVSDAVNQYGDLGALPYEVIVQSIVQFEGRRKKTRR